MLLFLKNPDNLTHIHTVWEIKKENFNLNAAISLFLRAIFFVRSCFYYWRSLFLKLCRGNYLETTQVHDNVGQKSSGELKLLMEAIAPLLITYYLRTNNFCSVLI